MTMTNEEIVRDYRAAKTKMKQIGILADLNGCDSRTIVNILLEEGESVPGNFLPKRKKQAKGTGPVELEQEKESFELDTTNPPLIRTEMTVAQLVAALNEIPGDAVILGSPFVIDLTCSHNMATGTRRTSVSIERS